MISLRPILLILVVTLALFAQAQQDSQQQQDDSVSTLKVDVRLVNVFATVTDKNGAPVSDLNKDNFQVLEDGVPQKISVFDRESELPVSIVMAIDTSLSTKKDLPLEVESARRFATSIVRPIDAIALFQFSEFVDEVQPFTSNISKVERALKSLRPGSATALYDVLYLGSSALMKRQGRKVMVVITDGGDTISRVSYKEAVRAAQQAEAIVYSIIMVPIEASAGRDTGGEHALIQISKDTGGKPYYATSLNELDAAFKQIDRELRTQYLLAYYPSRRLADSDYRKIEIRVKPQVAETDGELNVRHRTGYYTSKFE
jgi:Ca-activated chloride channel family protein